MVEATTYLEALSDLLHRVEATDGKGRPLPLDEAHARSVELILRAAGAGRKVLLAGNGGSAAIVSHMQNDLCKAAGIRALVFHETPLLTALSNDEGYEHAYERPAELWVDAGDILVAVSSSGRSPNILRAAKAAQLHGARLMTYTGFQPDNPLRQLGDLNFWVPSDVYGYVEVAHQALGHLWTDATVALQHKGDPPSGFPR